MQLQTIVYVTSMDESIDWFSTLLGIQPSVRSEHWTSFEVGDANLALHLIDQVRGQGDVAFSLIVSEPLEVVAGRVTPTRAIAHEPFGRSFVVADPDGTSIQVNEHSA